MSITSIPVIPNITAVENLGSTFFNDITTTEQESVVIPLGFAPPNVPKITGLDFDQQQSNS